MKMRFLAAAAVAASVAAAPAAADVVQFTGTTQGCFNSGCLPTSGASVINGLTYTSGGFNHNTDVNGFLGIGGVTDNLGYFTLTGTPASYTGDVFTLLVNFTAPGTTSANYSALLHGTIQSGTNGGITVNFDNPLTQVLTAGGATITMTLPSFVGVSSDSTLSYVSAQFEAAVPEPATWAMMLMGFAGMGLAMRSRRRPTLAQVA